MIRHQYLSEWTLPQVQYRRKSHNPFYPMDARQDQNWRFSLIWVSSVDGKTPVPIKVNPITGRVLIEVSGAGWVSETERNYWNAKQEPLWYTPEDITKKGVANGYAGLDGTGKVPSSQLPSFVDDVLEYANLAGFPWTGETGKMYVALNTNKVYRWSGSAYIEISGSPWSTDAVTEWSTNLYFTTARVLGTLLAGLSTATSTAITATDSVLSAMGKLQAQLTSGVVHIGGVETVTGAKTFSATTTFSSGTNIPMTWGNYKIDVNSGTQARLYGDGTTPSLWVGFSGWITLNNDTSVVWKITVSDFVNMSYWKSIGATIETIWWLTRHDYWIWFALTWMWGTSFWSHSLWSNPHFSFRDSYTNNAWMVIDSGKVGIWTTTPWAKFEISWPTSDWNGAAMRIRGTGTGAHAYWMYVWNDWNLRLVDDIDNTANRLLVTTSGDLVVNGQNWTSVYDTYWLTVIGTGGWSASGVSGTMKYKLIGKTCFVEFTVWFTKNTLSGRVRLQLPYQSRNGWEIAINAYLWGIGTKSSNAIWYAVLHGNTIEWLNGIWQAGDWSSYPATCYGNGAFCYEIL